MSSAGKKGRRHGKKEEGKKLETHLGGTCCSCSLTSSANVPKEIAQLKNMQVTPKGQPKQAIAKGRASTPAPTIEVKLCFKVF